MRFAHTSSRYCVCQFKILPEPLLPMKLAWFFHHLSIVCHRHNTVRSVHARGCFASLGTCTPYYFRSSRPVLPLNDKHHLCLVIVSEHTKLISFDDISAAKPNVPRQTLLAPKWFNTICRFRTDILFLILRYKCTNYFFKMQVFFYFFLLAS
jgi:hypothetical protein